MAKPFTKTLLGLVAACVVQGTALAQDVTSAFDAAVNNIRLPQNAEFSGQIEQGYQSFDQLLGADLDADSAYEIWTHADPAIISMLLADERTRDATSNMLRIARARTVERSRDEARIAELVQGCFADDYETRRASKAELAAKHGEFAVPAFVRSLADADASREQELAMVALIEIGRPTVLPLIQTLKSDSEHLRRNAALVLSNLGDRRAAGALAHLANSDERVSVRAIAQSALQKMGMSGADPVDTMLAQSRAHLVEDGFEPAELSPVVWSWAGHKLAATDVAPVVYKYELSKQLAQDALVIAPENGEAATLLTQAYVAQIDAVESGEVDGLAGSLTALKLPAIAMGDETISAAVEAAIRSDLAGVTEASADLLGEAESSYTAEQLVPLLEDGMPKMRYRGALNLTRLGEVASADPTVQARLVTVLAEGVAEESIHRVLVVANDAMVRSTATELGARRGLDVTTASTGLEGSAAIMNYADYDAVVIFDGLTDAAPATVARLARSSSETVKIVALVRSDETEEALGASADGVLRPEEDRAVTGEEMLAALQDALGDFDDGRGSADRVAAAAAGALAQLGRDVDTTAAGDSLAAQLDRADEVAIPSALALAYAASAEHAPALIALVTGSRTDEMRTAAANGLGGALARAESVSEEDFEQLFDLVTDEEQPEALRTALAAALGRAPLAAPHRARLVSALTQVAGTGE